MTKTGVQEQNRRATYRAKDVVMAATVDIRRRLVLVTGAIDTNDHDILVRVAVPEAGTWQVVKSETNLTDAVWGAWQITFGEGIAVAEDPGAVCRQFGQHHVSPARDRITFYDGEIRPGEAVLKMFTVTTRDKEIVMSHTRPLIPGDLVPPIEASVIAKGFPTRPVIEAILPVHVIDER